MLPWLLLILPLLAPALRSGEEVVENWPDGSVRARYEVDAAGRRNGPYLAYHENGKLHVRASYRANERSGTYQEFYPSGRKALDAKYRGGQLQGKYEERDETGRASYVAHYADGILHGKVEAFAGKERLCAQRWKKGALVELDGVAPYPRPLDEIRHVVAGLLDTDAALPGSASDAWATTDADEAADEGLRLDREKALRNLAAYRYLCGVPHEGMQLNAEFNRLTTMGARLCAKIGHLDHTPDNPGWPDDEYRDGYTGTSHSNLSVGTSIAGSVHSYMNDSDASNIDRVGHRLWCLAERLSKVGFGRSDRFSAMYVRDTSGKGGGGRIVSYPPAGYVPLGFFDDRHAWSITLRGGSLPRIEDVTVDVRPLDERFVPGERLELDHLGKTGLTLVFRPVGVSVHEAAAYLVHVKGLGGKLKKTGLKYLVQFERLDE
ncbi:MAG: hypothetical protein GY711_02175 [bacterium]|nr:hypothetical protein [bacterium]